MDEMIEAYDVFPWVMKDKNAEEYERIDEICGMTYYDLEGNKREFPLGQVACRTYINPRYIRTVHDEMIYDSDGTGYPSCTIRMGNDEVYYLACLWNQYNTISLEGIYNDNSQVRPMWR